MGNQDLKLSRYQRLLLANPWCCHCGGTTRATTVDHVPAQASILKGHFPEDHEFPGCDACNGGTRRDDQIFALHCMELDTALPPEEWAARDRLRHGVKNNYPEGLPIERWNGGRRIVMMSPEFPKAVETAGAKLACALYYKHTGGKFLSPQHRIWTSWLHGDWSANTAPILNYIVNLLPNTDIGRRSNIKNDRTRFVSKFGLKPHEDDFFMVASQFGGDLINSRFKDGLVVWSIATKNPSHKVKRDPRGSVRGIFGQGANQLTNRAHASAKPKQDHVLTHTVDVSTST